MDLGHRGENDFAKIFFVFIKYFPLDRCVRHQVDRSPERELHRGAGGGTGGPRPHLLLQVPGGGAAGRVEEGPQEVPRHILLRCCRY